MDQQYRENDQEAGFQKNKACCQLTTDGAHVKYVQWHIVHKQRVRPEITFSIGGMSIGTILSMTVSLPEKLGLHFVAFTWTFRAILSAICLP